MPTKNYFSTCFTFFLLLPKLFRNFNVKIICAPENFQCLKSDNFNLRLDKPTTSSAVSGNWLLVVWHFVTIKFLRNECKPSTKTCKQTERTRTCRAEQRPTSTSPEGDGGRIDEDVVALGYSEL